MEAVADMCNNDAQFVITSDNKHLRPLPKGTYIQLANNMGYMRLRNIPFVLRMHDYSKEDAQKEMYSEILRYHPFQNEQELPINDFDKCIQLFSEKDPGEDMKPIESQKSKIQKVKEKIFPFKKYVESSRELIQDLQDFRPQHIGDQLDPEDVMDNEELEAEGISEAGEFAVRDPGIMPTDGSSSNPPKEIFRRIDISNKIAMRRSARQLDKEQRLPFDEMMKFCKQTRQSWANPANRMPKPPLLKIHGGAGCGKSKLIQDISTWSEHWLRVDSNRDPSHPHVIKVAPTGRAARVINGLTIHTAFSMNFGNAHYSLADHKRDIRRTQLSEVKIVIIDEMSMVKSDMLYQLNRRFQEVTQSEDDFGGLSVILCGDLLQLRPVLAKWIFEEPSNKAFGASYSSNSLWELFEPIELTQNHRQGEDKVYADVLNRMRKGLNTEDDFRLLESRVSSEFPSDSWHFYGFNKLVEAINIEKLNSLSTQLFSFKARHSHPHLLPPPKFGKVKDTSFDEVLGLKVGARVMLIHNLDLVDGLINGTLGFVRGFIQSNGTKATNAENAHMILIEFDEEEDGLELRKKQNHLLRYCPLKNVTPIARMKFEHRVGDAKKGHAATNTLFQFPITLAWAMTIHKCQGITVKPPESIRTDVGSCWLGGMAYVVCGRAQRLNQLFLSSFKRNNIKVDPMALQESDRLSAQAKNRLKSNTFNMTWGSTSPSVLKIASLNIQSLGGEEGHISDVKADHTLQEADILCLSETWLPKGTSKGPEIEDYVSFFASNGRGSGVALYLKESFKVIDSRPYIRDECQLLRVELEYFVIIAAYRSPSFNSTRDYKQFTKVILDGIHKTKVNIVCGDMNIHFNPHSPRDNHLTSSLYDRGFVQLVTQATHIKGHVLDHMYVKSCPNVKMKKPLYQLHYPYYSDHDAVLLMLKRV